MRRRLARVSYKVVLAVTVIGALAGITACDTSLLNDAVDNFKVVIGLEPINTTSTVLVTDAKTGELIESDVYVLFEGQDADAVIDTYSDPLQGDIVSDGILNFGIQNAITPSVDAPARITLSAQAPGYLPIRKTISIEEVGANAFTLKMIRENNRPEGVIISSSTEGSTDASGAVTVPIKATASSANSVFGVELDVQQGVIARDEEGNPLSGNLSTKVTYYDPSDPQAMASVPADLTNENGENVLALGVINLEMANEQGQQAASLSTSDSGKIEFRFKVDPDAYNIDFESAELGLYNHSGAASKRAKQFRRSRYEIEIINGNVFIAVWDGAIDVLIRGSSSSNDIQLGDYQLKKTPQPIILGMDNSRCTNTFQVNRNGNTGPLSVEVSTMGQNREFTISGDSNSYEIQGLNDGAEYTYTVTPASGIPTSVTETFSCNAPQTQVSLPAPSPTLITAEVQVNLQCQNSTESVAVTNIPGSSVSYRKSDAEAGTSWKVVNDLSWDFDEANNALTGGSFTVLWVEQGAEYTFKITYDGKMYRRDIIIDDRVVVYEEIITDGICQ
ncbi:hypothetical protein [Gracilimonas mengyeensis]|uniref:DUF4382 domain-containing protein n=1 Tax=Gracilimonas mengyeensis TaxID=1302730 RepID=A0A521EZ64_9BACT|nr:hypothetical protein [Gracilimonas mengyeensis]SMO89153.1 hypothetical protein SAMN06265219_11459 [Gracilimonas mengyeensis]